MKEFTLALIVGVVVILFFLAVFYYYSGELPPAKVNKYACETDADCGPGGNCCHPQECVNKEWNQEFAKTCQQLGTPCTDVCVKCPECKCINNKCTKTGTISDSCC